MSINRVYKIYIYIFEGEFIFFVFFPLEPVGNLENRPVIHPVLVYYFPRRIFAPGVVPRQL